MNILITAPSLNPSKNVSGISTVVQTIISHNNKHQYFHYLLGSPDKKLSKSKWLLMLVKQVVLFPLTLKNNKIDIVHQNLPFDPKGIIRESIISFWCWMLNVPVVLHVHGGQFITHGTKNIFFLKLSKLLFSSSKQVIVLSILEKDVLRDSFDFSHAKILSNSIDLHVFDNIQPKIMSDIPKILYLGRIDENKGILEMISAFKKLYNEQKFRFILCGTGSLKDMLIDECVKIFGNDFEYKGVVLGQNKINIIKDSTFFILPSYFEGLPMSLLETMAARVVPIVTNVGSMRQVVEHGISGFLVEKQNSEDLYEKLKLIFSDPELYKSMSENARKTIIEHYDINDYITQLNKIYKTALIK